MSWVIDGMFDGKSGYQFCWDVVYKIWVFPKIVGEIPPKSSIWKIGFSIIFTIHFGVPLFLETPIYKSNSLSKGIQWYGDYGNNEMSDWKSITHFTPHDPCSDFATNFMLKLVIKHLRHFSPEKKKLGTKHLDAHLSRTAKLLQIPGMSNSIYGVAKKLLYIYM